MNKNPQELNAVSGNASEAVQHLAETANEFLDTSSILLRRVQAISKASDATSGELADAMLIFHGGGKASFSETMYLASTSRRLARESASAGMQIGVLIGIERTFTHRFLSLSHKPARSMFDLHFALELLREQVLHKANPWSLPDKDVTPLDQQLASMIEVSQHGITVALRSKEVADRLYHLATELVHEIERRSH